MAASKKNKKLVFIINFSESKFCYLTGNINKKYRFTKWQFHWDDKRLKLKHEDEDKIGIKWIYPYVPLMYHFLICSLD